MEFTGGLILLAVAAALLFFGRGRGGRSASYFSKLARRYDVQRSDPGFVCRRVDGCNPKFAVT